MADVDGGPGPEGAACWSRDLSDEDQPPVYVPGVSPKKNFRARQLLNSQKVEVTEKRPAAATRGPMDALKSAGDGPGPQVPDKGGMRSASLKDLCPEDKRRIANLIKELARVSEEKEVTEERLKAEQESFEKKIRQLEQQNELIIKEREALQQQYRECQELLSLYQKYLSEQQEKLTHSLSELEAAKRQEEQASSHRSLSQPLAPLEMDGSYLSVARPQTLYKNNRVAHGSPRGSVAPSCRNAHVPGTTIQDGHPEGENEFLVENVLHGKCNNVLSPGKQKVPFERTPEVGQRRNRCPLQTCFFHKKWGSMDHEFFHDSCCFSKRLAGPPCESSAGFSCSPYSVELGSRMEPGKRLSEERRKQLLLQKIELEIEKERLQNLLAKQEAKLLLQQQQLCQSRLDYSRFKGCVPNSEELLMDEALMGTGGRAPVLNGTCGGLSSPKDCLSRTPVLAKGRKGPGSSGGNSSAKRSVGFHARGEDNALWAHVKKEAAKPRREMTLGSRKDVATSPGLTGCSKELVTAATSPIQRDTSRYEASLFDLVEAVSPGLQHRPREGCSHSKALKPQNDSRRNPAWGRNLSGANREMAELEESRILEEIFFI